MSKFQDYMEEVKDEIKNAPKMFRQLQKRDDEIKDLKQQRNDLRDACKKLMTCVLSSTCGDCDIKCPDNENIAMTFAEAAIAKAKP